MVLLPLHVWCECVYFTTMIMAVGVIADCSRQSCVPFVN